MAMVKLSTKYALNEEQIGLIQKGKTWWLRNRTTSTFVKIPYTPANQTFDFDLDLEDGEYQCSCGDYNALDSNGRHCTQNIYFYVQDGKLHYVKRKDEFPSMGGGSTGDSAPSPFNPFAKPATPQASPFTQQPPSVAPTITTESTATVASETYEPLEGFLYCRHNSKVVTPEYTCVVDFVSDNLAVSGLDCCRCCAHKQELFLKKE